MATIAESTTADRVSTTRFASRTFAGRRADLLAVGALVGITLALTAWRVAPVDQHLRGDWASFFVPMYAHLGERLRAGDVPGWNPHQFAGGPFAADPESGWGYLLAMVSFTLLPLGGALLAFLTGTALLAGLSTYALARALRLGPLAAFAAAGAYEFGWLWQMNGCCVPFAGIAAWLPLALLGAERALRTTARLPRLGWWFVAGLAIDQMLTVWLGQGIYYALLVVGGYIAWRALLAPPNPVRSFRGRALDLAANGIAVVGLGFAFAAMNLLPAIEYNLRSSLAGGNYAGWSAWEQNNLGWTLVGAIDEMLGGNAGGLWWYFGAAAVVLALLAPLIARDWSPWPLFLAFVLAAAVLTMREPTPFHKLVFLALPRFESLHVHYPARVLIVAFLPLVLLAGATIDRLPRWRPVLPRDALLLPLPALALLLVGPLTGIGGLIGKPAQAAAAAATVLLALATLPVPPVVRRALPAALALLLLLDPGGRLAFAGFVDGAPREDPLPVSLAEFASPAGAAGFLAGRSPEDGRFFGFDPEALPDAADFADAPPEFPYRDLNGDADAVHLVVNNRATLLGLPDLQGYNPIQTRRYVDFVDALNGHPQEYHEIAVFPDGLDSPLLDLLAARYVVVPRPRLHDDGPVGALLKDGRAAYRGDDAVVIERKSAFPRAWLLHEARQAGPAETLRALADGSVDPRTTALLEAAPPALAPPPKRSDEAARVTAREPDRLRLEVEAAAPALLMLSEIYDPNWRATVDGAPAPVLVADHALRAVPVAAGRHTVELVYDPPLLRVGIVASLLTLGAAALVGVLLVLGRRTAREARP